MTEVCCIMLEVWRIQGLVGKWQMWKSSLPVCWVEPLDIQRLLHMPYRSICHRSCTNKSIYNNKALLATSVKSLSYHRSRCAWLLWVSSAGKRFASSRTETRRSGHLLRRLVAWQVHTGSGTRSAQSQICWFHIPLRPDSAQTYTDCQLQDRITLCITCSRNKGKEEGETENKTLTINTRNTQQVPQRHVIKQTFGFCRMAPGGIELGHTIIWKGQWPSLTWHLTHPVFV
jgi:hypothetical protein